MSSSSTIDAAPAAAADRTRSTAPPAGPAPAAPLPAPVTDPARGLHEGHLHRGPEVAAVLHTEVDVEAYTRSGPARLPVDAEALAAEAPLTPPQRLALRVLQRLEASALAESRAMLATWTGNEARITAFLATWMVWRRWQSRALRDLLALDAERQTRPDPEPPAPSPSARLRRVHVDRVQPLLAPAWTALAGEDVTAGHMARMSLQESWLRTALRALAPTLPPTARALVTEVAAGHDDAVAFFVAEARARVTRSRGEARTARLVLALDSPAHGGGVPDPELPAALAVIAADPAVRADLRRDAEEITRLLPLRPHTPRGLRTSPLLPLPTIGA